MVAARILGWCGAVLLAFMGTCLADEAATRAVRVDESGILRWVDDGNEVALFGVNYYPPHVFDYTYLKALNVSIEATIDRDLAHFVRLGLDALRLHVFDREISDPEGNLLDNEHLQLLDYLVARAKARGIYTVLTPIAWWPSATPEGGFSSRFTMPQMTTDAASRPAQCRYLTQFMNHVNRYTGQAYKDEAAVPFFELINEPVYPPGTTDAQVKDYIDTLVDAVRETGCRKALFYNGWDNHYGAVRDSRVDGSTFGWYPSGLCALRELRENFLPKVAEYPPMSEGAMAGKAKIVYEFETADIGQSCLYPAMARAFRQGGAQMAAEFQYDPLPLAPFNVGWQTHYLNMLYSPRKALSLAIASEAFHRLPRKAGYGPYPESNRFDVFRVSYEEDLSEMATDTVFLYTNDTRTAPPKPEALERVAGYGSSPVVTYDGTGLYFLDRIEPGMWRLEVYPDNIWVDDPFATPSLDREVSRLVWRERRFAVQLPDLGDGFMVKGLNEGNNAALQASGAAFSVRPGLYLLSKRERASSALPARVGRIPLREYVVPDEKRVEKPVVVSVTPTRQRGDKARFRVRVVAQNDPKSVVLRHGAGGGFAETAMTRVAPYEYVCEAPVGGAGHIDYCVRVDDGSGECVYPAGDVFKTTPGAALFEADEKTLARIDRIEGPVKMERGEGDTPCLRLKADGFEKNSAGGVRVEIAGGLGSDGVPKDGVLVVRARSLSAQTSAFELGVIESDGSAHGTDVALTPAWRDVRIPVRSLHPLWGTQAKEVHLEKAVRLSFLFGAWLYARDAAKPHGFEVQRVWLEGPPRTWGLDVAPADGPCALFTAGTDKVSIQTHLRHTQRMVGGMNPDTTAFQLDVPGGFGPAPSAIAFRVALDSSLRMGDTAPSNVVLRVRARSLEAATPAVEVVLEEDDGAPWGTNVSLSTEWREVDVPLDRLVYYKHWGSAPRNRGGDGDRLAPNRAAVLNVCFGAWLCPGHENEPHGIEVESVALVRKP